MRRADVTDDMRPYEPRAACRELFLNKSRWICLSGPAGTGKSRGGLEKLHVVLEKYAGARALLVRKTRASLTDSTLVTFEHKVVPPGHRILRGAGRANRHSYNYTNGSELVVGGLDKPSKILSTDYDIIMVDEAIETFEGDCETLITRLRHWVLPYQQLICFTNPGVPTHWLKQRANRGGLLMLESRHEDNPELYERGEWTEKGLEYLAALDDLTGPRYHRLRHGRWVGAEGMVYEQWDEALHHIDRFPIPADWRRIRSVDFGYTNPFVCQWWAIDPDGRMYMYREIYRSQRIVSDHAAQIKALSGEERFEATVADHDAEDRATLAACGIFTLPAWKSVQPGIEAVQQRLRRAGDGKPRLFILRDSLVERDPLLMAAAKPCSTVEEVDGYIWAPEKDGKAAKEEPLKVNDHGVDCARYACAYVDQLEYGGQSLKAEQIMTVAR